MPDHNHDHKRKPKPGGPKERELAVALTVAVLGASRIDAPLASIEQMRLELYDRMLGGVSKPRLSDQGDERGE